MMDEVSEGIICALYDELESVKSENEFLNQRLRDFNKKTWFPVHEENLKLANENEQLKLDVQRFKEYNFHNHTLKQKFYNDREELKDEIIKLKEVIKSVEAFTKQYSK